ncbi:MAG: hypothetical protein GYA15_02340 [Leptolinea sp.]|jgi:fatty acid-binding protein DegV|nr:hypothetical protein [Leptolinea sp.]
MPDTIIITDSAAQFVHPDFLGKELVRVFPLRMAGKKLDSGFYLSAKAEQDIQVFLKEASDDAGCLIAILSSGCLSALPNQILTLLKGSSAAPRIMVIDSMTVGVGTGFLVGKAAEMARQGLNSTLIEQTIRKDSSSVYTTIVLPDLTPMVPIGLVDAAQANAASILGLQSIFSLEEGLPTPLCKVRSRRAAYEYLIEFIDEFENFHLLAAIQDSDIDSGDLQVINDHISEFFPNYSIQSFQANRAWKSIFGDSSYGFVIISNEKD